ncbi:MAG TPA: ROK family protein [Thermoleophilaceae bacterium]|nr:ROK family protein [Thermoleophilaceae bacterium]
MVLGVDVGGTKIAVAGVKGVRTIHAVEHATVTDSAEALLDGLEAAVRRAIEQTGEPEAIGVGVPSQIDYLTGTVETSVNIPLTGVPLREELGRRFGVPVFVDNDANCAALAEAHILGVHNLVMLTLGTGVGGGVVTRGLTFRGANGLGAELGHFTLNPDGPPCPGSCPNRGCIEAYCSGQALERDATELAQDKPGSRLSKGIGDDGMVKGHELVEAAEEGDPDAMLLFDNFARMLGVAIAGYVNVFEPDRLSIGGGVSRSSHLFLERAEREAGSRALPALYRRVTIALAEGGADAGVIGAGILAAQEIGGITNALRDTAIGHPMTTEGSV